MPKMIPILEISSLIFLGFLMEKTGLIKPKQIKLLEHLLFKIILPVYYFVMIYEQKINLNEHQTFFKALSILIISGGLLTYFIFHRLSFSKIWIRIMGVQLSNINLFILPISLISNLKADQIILFGLFNPILILLSISILLMSFQKKFGFKKILISTLLTPIILLPMLGVFLKFQQIQVPYSLLKVTELISKTNIYFGLFIFGLNLAYIKFNQKLINKDLVFFILTKHLMMPILGLIIGKYVYELNSQSLFNFLLIGISPMPFMVYLVASEYQVETDKIRNMLAVSSICGCFEVLIYLILMNFQII
jgi:predicted permease